MNKYDIAIIGAGPCGYVAGIRAAQLGLRVILFEEKRIGGICLNEGCIPTKALLASAEIAFNIKRAKEFGIDIKDYEIDFVKVFERKEAVVKKLASGVSALLKAKKIDLIKEKAHLTELPAKYILIATGSLPSELLNIKFDGVAILSSSDALNLRTLPRSIAIIGGGVIGCEFASMFNVYGVEVSIIEMMSQVLPTEDREVAKKLEQIFKKRGIKIFTGTKVVEVKKGRDEVALSLSSGEALYSEKIVVCVGRSPNSKDIDIEKVGIETDTKGWIKVDNAFRTNIESVYAAGDVIGGILLAHVASREGMCAVENISGVETHLDYDSVPNCIYTNPEIASVGISEEKTRERNLDIKARKFLFSAVGKAHILGDVDGFVKLIVDSKSDRILGAQIIGPHATELISELTLCVQFGITSEKLASVIHAHPTLSEAIYEASAS